MSNPVETSIATDQDTLDKRYVTLCNLDSLLCFIPLDFQGCCVVEEFWKANFPFFNPRSGNTTEQKRKDS